MYTKQEASQVRQEFWTSFGQYMQPVPSASGQKVNWINYKTGVKAIRFRMDAGYELASVKVEIWHKDDQVRLDLYRAFVSLKNQLDDKKNETFWLESTVSDGKEVSAISWIKEGVSIFRKEDWPEIISFLKGRIILLDAFWTENRDIFESI